MARHGNTERLVLSDASPLIALARIDGLAWLQSLFGMVHVPQSVRSEIITGQGFADEAALLLAEAAGYLVPLHSTPTTPPLPDLDAGESACIRIALAHTGSALLLMDERAGRAVAREKGLAVAGTAAVIGMAKRKGLIPAARDVFARLHASDFRISAEVIWTVLQRVGE